MRGRIIPIRAVATQPFTLADHLRLRQFRPVYHPDVINHCPGCGRTHWWIGRITAECAHCDTALMIVSKGGRRST